MGLPLPPPAPGAAGAPALRSVPLLLRRHPALAGSRRRVREPQVEHRGEVARRGSIVDVFPSTADGPVRIDLWGDEVDRLTSFSVSDQRSTDDIDCVEIFGCRELLPTDDVRAHSLVTPRAVGPRAVGAAVGGGDVRRDRGRPWSGLRPVRHYIGATRPASHASESESQRTRSTVRSTVRGIAEFVGIYRKRIASPGHAFPIDTSWQPGPEEDFLYQDARPVEGRLLRQGRHEVRGSPDLVALRSVDKRLTELSNSESARLAHLRTGMR